MNKYMFANFEEYAVIMGIDSTHPSWEAFKIVWSTARFPPVKSDSNGKLSIDKSTVVSWMKTPVKRKRNNK